MPLVASLNARLFARFSLLLPIYVNELFENFALPFRANRSNCRYSGREPDVPLFQGRYLFFSPVLKACFALFNFKFIILNLKLKIVNTYICTGK